LTSTCPVEVLDKWIIAEQLCWLLGSGAKHPQ